MPVLATPFDEELEVDYSAVGSLAAWSWQQGVNGVVCNANASEFTTLSRSERMRITETVRAAIPEAEVIVGVTATSAGQTAGLARHAAAAGASAVLAMPPYPFAGQPDATVAFYEGLVRSAGIPVILQNSHPPAGTPMSPALISRIVRETGISVVKEESKASAHGVSALLTGDPELVVLGGEGGRWLVQQHRRGIRGVMPASSLPDVHVALWRLLESGDGDGARSLIGRVLPLVTMADFLGPQVHKEILRQRGILVSARIRQLGWSAMDTADSEEISVLLRQLLEVDMMAVSE
jgi:dihydrodipicolinate synthase/N-acetylneuraminate lyase